MYIICPNTLLSYSFLKNDALQIKYVYLVIPIIGIHDNNNNQLSKPK